MQTSRLRLEVALQQPLSVEKIGVGRMSLAGIVTRWLDCFLIFGHLRQ